MNNPGFDWESFITQANDKVNSIPACAKLGEVLGVPPLWAVSGVSAFGIGFLLFGVGSQVICNLVGFLYPAYASFKALEDGSEDDHRQWLTYWVVFSCFNLIESFIDYILYWVPLFYIFKVFLLWWMFSERFKGALVIYQNFIVPVGTKYKEKIDEHINKVSDNVTDAIKRTTSKDK